MKRKKQAQSIDCSYACGGRNSKSNNNIMFGTQFNQSGNLYLYQKLIHS